MSGDGLTDLVRIRNGEVCYWPNLGLREFRIEGDDGRRPLVRSRPIFSTRSASASAMSMATGITDILYIAPSQVAVYFNQAGNGWSTARLIDPLPSADNLSDVTVTDLFGNGTACLVWSSPLPKDTAGRCAMST